jgi:hypothetical protein
MSKRKIKSNDVEDAVILEKASSGYDNIEPINESIKEANDSDKDNNEKKENIIDFPDTGETDRALNPVKEQLFILNRTFISYSELTKLKFILKVIEKYPSRNKDYAKRIKVENIPGSNWQNRKRVIATDGYRIHYAEIDFNFDLPCGEYLPYTINKDIAIKKLDDKDSKFPNWKEYEKIQYNKASMPIDLRNTGLGRDTMKTLSLTKLFHRIIKKLSRLINIKYLDDLIKDKYEIFINSDKKAPLKFKLVNSRPLIAYIAPIDMEE